MIHVRSLTKRYGAKLALDDVSFDVQAGDVLGLLGLNGAGKSTAMNIITGYIGATSGTVTVDGHDIAQAPLAAKRVMGYLPERLAFYDEMRVREYLDFVCDLKQVRVGRERHVAAICEKVGIAHVTHRVIGNLSKGFRQRLGFAQALMGEPKVLILDEPTSGLDPAQITEIRSLIQDVGKASAVVISSHILSEIQTVCTRVVVLHEGRLLVDDTPENLGRTAVSCRTAADGREAADCPTTRPSHRVVARIQGDPARVRDVLSRAPGIERVRKTAQREPDAYEYLIEGARDQDVRVSVFRALAKADLPLLSAQSGETSLEQVFLQLIAEQS